MSAILDWLYGADELQSEGAALDAKLSDLNTKDYGPGGKFYNAGDWEEVKQNLATGQVGDVTAQLDAAFAEGWQEGKDNVSGTVGSIFGTAGDVITSVLKGVPWWVWGLVLLYFLWPIIGAKLARQAT